MLDEELLYARLVQPKLISRILRVESTASTNADLAAAADSPDFATTWPHMSVLTAEEQTAGRGRLGRSWSSPAGTALSTSILLRPRLDRHQWHWLTLTAGLALVRALRSMEVPAALKWPNDVHVHGRKIAGLLALVPQGDPHTIILGCGVNVLLDQGTLPTANSTSLLLELRRASPDSPHLDGEAAAQLRTELLADWLEHFAALVHQLEHDGGMGPVREQIISVISTVGQQVRVELPNGTAVRGTAVAVEHDGALSVDVTARRRTVHHAGSASGGDGLWEAVGAVRETYTAGDVVHLRAADQ